MRSTTNGVSEICGLLLMVTACGSDPVIEPPPGPRPDAGTVVDRDGGVTPQRDAGFGEPPPFEWPLPTEDITISPSRDWRNRITVPDDPFLNVPANFDGEEIRWIKFSVLMRDPSKVYFQNSAVFGFHYDFAVARLNPFNGMTHAEFDAVSRFEENQEVILGAVLIPPSPSVNEYAIQLVRQDAYHPEMLRIVFELVRDSIDARPNAADFYFPTFEQEEMTQQWGPWLAERNIQVSSAARWTTRDACYANGWAYGRLVSVAPGDIDAAYLDGRLGPTDVLLTDSVPAEVPFVAGIISQAASTPNSHVAILAQSFGVPFAHVADPERRAAIDQMVGREVILRAAGSPWRCVVDVLDVDGQLDEDAKSALRAMLEPPALTITPKAAFGRSSASVDDLGPADLQFFGGKAANFGLLRDEVPNNSPAEAIAFSFDLWDAYLDQTLGTGKSLRQEIDDRLSSFTYPPSTQALADRLQEVRDLIEDVADFDGAMRTDIAAALGNFDGSRRIRFRSSTNVEDSDQFTGAGLYESHSGCRADDEDADEIGPSLCKTEQPKERGVYRAMRKVYSSFYNFNAFLERLRHGVPEAQVGMAVLAHYSFPDETELANGVGTYAPEQFGDQLTLVSQRGAVSVANPDGSAQPEIANIYISPNFVSTSITQHSSIGALGDPVLEDDAEYERLGRLMGLVADRYVADNPNRMNPLLDFEYKKIESRGLVLKQVRPLPDPAAAGQQDAFIVNRPGRYCVAEREGTDAFAAWRGKSTWQFTVRNDFVRTARTSPLIDSIDATLVTGSTTTAVVGRTEMFPGTAHGIDEEGPFVGFTVPGRTVHLRLAMAETVVAPALPVVTTADTYLTVRTTYDAPVPGIGWMGPEMRDGEIVWLSEACPDTNEVKLGNQRIDDDLMAPNGLRIQSGYWYPEAPRGISAGYTAPMFKWDSTTITGLASTPIVLRSIYAQTFSPGHHNFSVSYMFDPWLEPTLSEAAKAELTTANVRALFVDHDRSVWVVGLDDTLRRWE